MRIDSLGRVVSGGGAAARGAAAGGFRILDPGSAESLRDPAPLRSSPQLDALIALQALPEESPRERRRREVRRGRGLLDALDGLKLALIDGRGDPQALSALVHGLSERRAETGEPGLDEALAAIELRAHVELAKRRA